ncbi:MAG: histidine phosphatase family protein [Campylobacteraceae bacterium]|nr:histidine phosphatase family protein [Campylobacteraceae bacterium]
MSEHLSNIFLIRHGETTWNLENRWQGSKNSDLTPLGITQVEKTKVNLSNIKIDYAYVSPSKRAQDSMKILLSHTNIKAIVLNDLREITLGSWEGKTHKEVKKINPQQLDNFWHKPELFYMKNAETYEVLQHRVIKTLEDVFAKHKGCNILIVSHGLSIKVAVAFYSGLPLSDLPKMEDPSNAQIICLEKNKDMIRII